MNAVEILRRLRKNGMEVMPYDYEKGDYFFNKYRCITSDTDRVIGLSVFNALVRLLKQKQDHTIFVKRDEIIKGKQMVQVIALEEAEEDRSRWIKEKHFTEEELRYYEELWGKDNCKIAKF